MLRVYMLEDGSLEAPFFGRFESLWSLMGMCSVFDLVPVLVEA